MQISEHVPSCHCLSVFNTLIWLHVNQSITYGVVVSLFRDSYSKSVRLGMFKSVENNYLNGDVTPRIF